MYNSVPLRATGLAACAANDTALSFPYLLVVNHQIGYGMVVPVSPTVLLIVGFNAASAFTLVLGGDPKNFGLTVTDATAAAAPGAAPGAGQLLVAGNGVVATDVPPVVASYLFLNRTWEISVAPSTAWLSEMLGPAQMSVIEVGLALVIVVGTRARCVRRERW